MQNQTGFSNPFGSQQGIAPNPQSQINSKVFIHQSKIEPSEDKNPQKRLFKGKYELDCAIPVKYNTVDYFMLVENVRINNENAVREIKRGKATDILNQVLDSLEFLSYVQK